MKRVLTGIVATALVLSLGVTSAFAAGWGHGLNYVDADGDGVCDNCTGGGRYFVDADGDGVCDNYAGGGRGAGRGGRGGYCR